MHGSKMKGGPGSRGGKVVGMTKGGNAIYAGKRLPSGAKKHLEEAGKHPNTHHLHHEALNKYHTVMAAHSRKSGDKAAASAHTEQAISARDQATHLYGQFKKK